MPKVNHRKGGSSKHVSSMDDVKARNEGRQSAYDAARSGEPVKKEGEEEEEDAGPQQKRSGPAALIKTDNPNAVKHNVLKEGVEITRREREEIEKNAARRRYEEMHKRGETEESQKDMARLAAVKARREEATKKRSEDEEKANEKEKEKQKEKPRDALINELKDIMGTEGGKKGKKKKKEDKEDSDDEVVEDKKDNEDTDDEDGGDKKEKTDETKEETKEEKKKREKKEKKEGGTAYETIVSQVKKEDKANKKKVDGTIEQCREAEEDFM